MEQKVCVKNALAYSLYIHCTVKCRVTQEFLYVMSLFVQKNHDTDNPNEVNQHYPRGCPVRVGTNV